MGRYVSGERWAGCFNIVGQCSDGGNFKNGCMANSKEKTLCRHSRAGGNPDFDLSEVFKVNRYFKLLDSHLIGNDDMSIFYFNPL